MDEEKTCCNCFEPIRLLPIGPGAQPVWMSLDRGGDWGNTEDLNSGCDYAIAGRHTPMEETR